MPWRQLDPEDEYAGSYETSPERNGTKPQESHWIESIRLAAFLMRRGYTGAMVNKVLRVVSSESMKRNWRSLDDEFD